MDELQAEMERLRQQAIESRGGATGRVAGDSGASAEAGEASAAPNVTPDAPSGSVQAMLRRAADATAEKQEVEVDAWGRPIFVNTDANQYRAPGMLDPENGRMLWLKPSTVAFDLGQPYGSDYRLHDETVHDCGSTVTGRTFDAGRPFQQASVYVGQKPRAAKARPNGRRKKKASAAKLAERAGMGGLAALALDGDDSDEEETPEQVVQELMSDPMKVEQLRGFAVSHLEKVVSEAVIKELAGETESGNVGYVVKQIKPRKLVIPMEQVDIEVKDSRKGIKIVAEDLELRTEEFRFEIMGQSRCVVLETKLFVVVFKPRETFASNRNVTVR